MADEAPRERSFRIGGLVEEGSIERDSQSLTVRFAVTDLAHKIPVTYTGLLPDLFKEGKGVVAAGQDWAPMACSMPTRCWPSTTRTTCRQKPPRP